MAENHQGNAGTHNPVKSDELSVDAFANLLAQPAEQETEETESEETEETTEETELEESEETEEVEAEETEDEGKAIDFDKLTPEQILEAAKAGKSRLLGDLGKTRKELRDLKAQLDEVRREKPAGDPLDEPKEVKNPRIAGLNTLEELKAEKKQAGEVAKWAQGILDEFGSAQADEVVFSEGDRELTKKQLLKIRNSAQEAIENDIPARLGELEKVETVKRFTAESEAKALELVPEIADDNSPIAATHKALMESPVLMQAIGKTPELKGVVALLSALAAARIEQLKAKPGKAATTTAKEGIPKPQAPGGAPAGGAATSKPGAAKVKVIEQRRKAFEGSGSVDDYAALIASGLGG